ncbi:MAG TPA: S1 RNA-binding domain-containing protein [Anaerolineaceae bacterium]|nr:S1 RNA-binding domain-containing protein [Anaerolineaceae bacterium]
MESPVEQTKNNQPFKAKQKFEGKVLKTSLQGVLVDIGSDVPAFLHISQIIDVNNPKTAVQNVEDVLKVDDTVTVWIRKVAKDHISLTMVEPLLYEWRDLKPEMAVKGTVIRLESFGAFVEIGAERPGLVHVSELAHSFVRNPQEVVKVGDELDVMILEVDKRKKQIKLSVKALLEAPEEVVVETPKSGRRGKKAKVEVYEEESEELVPDPTYMEIALRQAMDRAEKRKPAIAARAKKQRMIDEDVDDIFTRTLQSKQSDD